MLGGFLALQFDELSPFKGDYAPLQLRAKRFQLRLLFVLLRLE